MSILQTRVAPGRALQTLTRCSEADLGSPDWWACLARNLDFLGEELVSADTEGLVAQIITDTPQYAASANLLTTMDTRLRVDVIALRHLVAERSGSATGADQIRDQVADLVHRVRTLDRASRRLLMEAYGRDLGGE
jgi:hypothetical protein